jgi:SAM-dependent methyltransferase
MTIHPSIAEVFYGSLDESLIKHVEILRNRVFESTKFQPQFDLLISDLLAIRSELKSSMCVVSIERMLLYGENLFSPLFDFVRYVSLDSSPKSADSRGAYNAHLISHPDFIKRDCESIRCDPTDLDFPDAAADVVLIPNLVHHVENQGKLWLEAARILKPGGFLYVFEPTLRELHQDPDDYLRYTPNGLRSVLRQYGLETLSISTTGGPFTAIAYCWSQALQYIAADERDYWSQWFEGHFAELIQLEASHPKNLVRKHTSFPTAFSLRAMRVVPA